MGKNFTVEIRQKCKVCNKPIRNNRYRSYCSTQCRNKFYNKKYYKQQLQWAADKRGVYAPNKIRCLICGRFFYQVCSHVYAKHKLTGREYRKLYGLDVKRGLLPEFLREIKADHVFANKTVDNLKAGKKYWFKPGDKRAGKYERSEQTLQRLRVLNKFNKLNKEKQYDAISTRV